MLVFQGREDHNDSTMNARVVWNGVSWSLGLRRQSSPAAAVGGASSSERIRRPKGRQGEMSRGSAAETIKSGAQQTNKYSNCVRSTSVSAFGHCAASRGRTTKMKIDVPCCCQACHTLYNVIEAMPRDFHSSFVGMLELIDCSASHCLHLFCAFKTDVLPGLDGWNNTRTEAVQSSDDLRCRSLIPLSVILGGVRSPQSSHSGALDPAH